MKRDPRSTAAFIKQTLSPVKMAAGGPLALGSIDPSKYTYYYDALGNLAVRPLLPKDALKSDVAAPIAVDAPRRNTAAPTTADAIPEGRGEGPANQGSTGTGTPGQGVSNSLADMGLAMMAAPTLGLTGLAVNALGHAIAGQQADAMGKAADAVAQANALSDLGITTVSDPSGNISTVSSPASVAAADAAMFGGVAPAADTAPAADNPSAEGPGAEGADADGPGYARGGEVVRFLKRATGSPEEGEVAPQQEQPTTDQGPRASAADTLKKLGLSVARGVPQIVTGAVDLAAMPFTLSGMLKPEQVVGSTEYLTKRGLLPPPQPGVVNETAELIGSAVNPAGAVKGTAAAALGAMTRGRQLSLPFGEVAKATPEAPMIRAYTGHTREIVGPYDMSRASRSADMGPGLYLTDNAEYASGSATKRLDRTVPASEAAPAVYPINLMKDKILLHDREYPREVLDKLRTFSKKVQNVEGPTVSGEYIYEQIRKAEIPKTMLPGVFKMMGFQGAEFSPGGVSKGRSYVIYDTANTAKGAFNNRKFAEGGEVAKVSDEDVRTYLKSNTALTDKEIAGLMQKYDVSKGQISRVTGVSMPEVERRYREATATTARPTVEGIGALWNKLHEKEFGAPVNLATAGRDNVDRQVGELQTEAARQQAEWDKKFGKTPAPIPTWGDTYNAWAPLYEQRFGTMINRPWNADVDAQTQKLALDQQYIQAVRDYNTKHGTNYAPEESVLGVNAQPNVYFYAPEKSNKGVKTLLGAAGTLAGMYLYPGMDPGNMFSRALITAGTEGAKRLFNEGGEVREEPKRKPAQTTEQFIKNSSKRR